LYLDDHILSKNSSWCMDIVDENCATTACFTKAYSRYMKGSGSILLISSPQPTAQESGAALEIPKSNEPATRGRADNAVVGCKRAFDSVACTGDESEERTSYLSDPAERKFDGDWKRRYPDGRFRYFSRRELLNIFGFPQTFNFPAEITNRKCYELIGNSINVVVAAHLILSAFDECEHVVDM
jgi:site-specific DNA-cytosine methylase